MSAISTDIKVPIGVPSKGTTYTQILLKYVGVTNEFLSDEVSCVLCISQCITYLKISILAMVAFLSQLSFQPSLIWCFNCPLSVPHTLPREKCPDSLISFLFGKFRYQAAVDLK